MISAARQARYAELAALERAEAACRLERAGKGAVAALCAWELAAILTGRLPMVSHVCRRNRWFEAVLLAIFLAHLHHAVASAVPPTPPTPTIPKGSPNE